MANTHDLFQTYDDRIKLPSAKEESLRVSREAIRDKIRSHFRDTLKVAVPIFRGQGSYSMTTLVNPLDGEYDIDDGVYLQHIAEDRTKWPTPETAHGWVVDATKGHTDEDPIDKPRCVRVRYKGQYHVDLPIYGTSDERPYLFEKGKQPYISDPTEFTDWFCDRVKTSGEQLRRIVRCLKAWRNYQNDGLSTAKGVVLTILAAQHLRTGGRDDMALAETASAIGLVIAAGLPVLKPVAPYEDLAASWAKDQRDKIVSAFQILSERGRDACSDEASRSEASRLWRRQLGDRFPLVEDDDEVKKENALRTGAPAILPSTDGRSA